MFYLSMATIDASAGLLNCYTIQQACYLLNLTSNNGSTLDGTQANVPGQNQTNL